MQSRRKSVSLIKFLIIILLGIWSLFPVFWNLMTAIKDRSDIFSQTPKFIFSPDWSAIKTAFSPGSASIYQYLWNSIIIGLGATCITLLIGIMAAYSLSKNRFKYKSVIWLLILATRLLPPISTIIPLFMMASKYRLIDTYILMILINVALNLPFSIWLLKSFFDSIPTEIQEASNIDGCTVFQSVIHILIPLVAPGVATAATFTFVQVWNEYTFSSIFTGTKVQTLPLLVAASRGEDMFMWQDMSARTSVLLVPVVLLGLYLQKNLVGGLTAGAIK